MVLEEYKETIAAAAGIFTIIQFLAPVLMCSSIIKQKSTKGIDVMPFLGGAVISCVFLQNAILIKDYNMAVVNIITLSLGLIYLSVYYTYTKEKGKFFIKLGKAVVFLAIIIGYALHENPEHIQFRFGLITTVLLLAIIAGPLLSAKEILRTKNTDALPMPVIISGTFVAIAWLLYGLAIHDLFIQLQNTIALILSVAQILLYVICKMQKPPKRRKKTN